MNAYNLIKRIFENESIVLPVVSMVVGIFLIAAITITLIDRYLHEIEVVVESNVTESEKMLLSSDLMEIARSRTRLTSQIIDTEDPFEQDELNLELEIYAVEFYKKRELLLKLPLNEYERETLLEEHMEIISVILPAQREAVELAMSDDQLDKQKAVDLLYNIVLPGQQNLIESLGKLGSLQQERISKLAEKSNASLSKLEIRVVYLIGLSLVATLLLLSVVILRIRNVQNKLAMANINLEGMVVERTDQLTQARDELRQYIAVVDKYIITSSTDKYGVITKASSAFCRISQYEENELIGQAHNIVRHEDMPVSTYEDMWGTIKQGRAWRGEIKNKAKDGSAYWVDVNIEPKLNKNGEIVGYTAIRQDITDKKRVEELAVTDPLTKLFNRLKLNDVLNHEVGRISRYPKDLSVILLDVDHFKDVNDNYGHHTGDSVLVSIAEIITSRARDTDVIGRWGGEEFLIICIETNIIGAEQLANDVRLAISSYDFGECGHITSSFGVAAFNKDESIESLLRRSDEALYQAKDAGRNRVVVDN